MKNAALIISLLASLLIMYGIYKIYLSDSMEKSGSTTDVRINGESVNIKQTKAVQNKLNNLIKIQEKKTRKEVEEMGR